MTLFIICLIVALIGAAITIVGFARPKTEPPTRDPYGRSNRADEVPRGAITGLGVVILAAAIIVTIFNSYTTIPVRTVGIELSFGKPVGTLNNGIHWVAPWHNIDKEWDGSVQTLKLTESKDDAGDPVTVRLANQTTANVDVTVQWNLHPSADVLELYRRYKTFGNVEDNLVKRQLQHSLNVAFADYDPLRTINGGQDKSQNIDALAAKAKAALQEAVGTGIEIGNLTIPIVHFDQATEDRLRQYQQALADTRIAEQRKATAQAQADANTILSASASTKDVGVQYQNCLDLIRDLANKGQLNNLPATFNCGGSSSGVIVGAK